MANFGHLSHRVKVQAANTPTVMASQHIGPGALPATPHLLPLALVTVNPTSTKYVTLGMDGAMVPATAPGKWDQLAAAGRT